MKRKKQSSRKTRRLDQSAKDTCCSVPCHSVPIDKVDKNLDSTMCEGVRNKSFSIAVVATMSAGKSTLLNSLIGKRLLPSRNEACTATVCRVEDVDILQEFEGRSKVKGCWQDWKSPIAREDVERWNDSKVDEIELRGNLPWIANTADDYRVLLIDTPGPNNSTNIDHARITENILKSSDFSSLIFVINAETPGTDDEWSFLNKICSVLKGRGHRAQIIFALNKIDKIDPEKAETIAGVLRNRMNQFRSIGFEKPVMVPVFGDLAVRIREAMRLKQAYRMRRNGPKPRAHTFGKLYEAVGSVRSLCALRSDIELVLGAKSFYREGLNLTSEVANALKRCDHRRLSDSEKKDMLLVGGRFFRFSDIRAAEKLSGVPVLETLLEAHLDQFANAERKMK